MENSTDTIIGVNVHLKGNIHNQGSIQVNGSVEGEVKSDDNVVVGESAKITGPVLAKVIIVSGEIHGLVQASEKIEINPTGKIFGDLDTKTLVIKEGATFIGNSKMPSNGVSEKKEPVIETILDKKEPEQPKKDDKDKEEAKADETPADGEEVKDKFGFFSKK